VIKLFFKGVLNKMAKKLNKIVVNILIGIFISIQFFGCGAKEKETSKQINNAGNTNAIPIIVTKVESQKLALTKTYTGTIEGEQQANIISQLAERIVEIPVKVGSVVATGDVLIRLNKSGATSQYYQAQSNLKNFERNLTRMKNLYENGAVSKQNLDDVQTGYDVAKANFDAAKAAVDITAPISGVVTDIKLNPGDFASPGMTLITVAKVNVLKIKLSIGEADIPYVTLGMQAKIYSEMNPSITATGRISEIARSADLSTRTFEVKVTFPNTKDQWFKPNMFGKAEINLTSTKLSLVIPRESVIYSDQGPIVFVEKDGRVSIKTVKLGLQNESSIEVINGLNAGDVVVKMGMNNLKEGSEVTVSKENLSTN
jgi:membrane fusion protein, multidrug efflux system